MGSISALLEKSWKGLTTNMSQKTIELITSDILSNMPTEIIIMIIEYVCVHIKGMCVRKINVQTKRKKERIYKLARIETDGKDIFLCDWDANITKIINKTGELCHCLEKFQDVSFSGSYPSSVAILDSRIYVKHKSPDKILIYDLLFID